MSMLELKIPPPVQMLIVGLAMWFASRLFPGLAISVPWYVAPVFAVVGLSLAGVSVITLVRAKTTVNPMQPGSSSTVVRSGVYALTRNPIYLGDVLVLLGWGAYLSNLVSLVLIAVFPLYITRYQIVPEEASMQKKFGDTYADYVRSVRRWF